MKVTDEKEYYRITPLNDNFRVWKDNIYVCASNYNGLFQVNMVNGTLEFVTKFVKQDNLAMDLFFMEISENILIFTPIFANEIALYDLDTHELYEIPLDNIYMKGITNTSNFAIYGDKIWIFPFKSRYIVELDYQNRQIGAIIDIGNIYHDFFNMDYSVFGVNGSYVCGDAILLVCWEKPFIIEFYPENKTVKFVKVQGCDSGFCALGGKGDKLYALNDDGHLYVWDIKSRNIIKRINIGEETERQNHKFYRNIYCYDKKVYLFPNGEITDMKTVDLELETVDTEIPQCLQDKNMDLYFGYTNENQLYLYNNENDIMCVDLKKQCVDWEVTVKYDTEELKKIIVDDKSKMGRGLIWESNAFLLQDFLQSITLYEGKESDNTVSRGNRIYHAMMHE